MATRWLSIQPSQEDLWDKAKEMGYVWIKTEEGFITKDELAPWIDIRTFVYKIYLHQETYGKTWAFTEEELMEEKENESKFI